MSTILPPPPIFKPTFIQMQRSGSTSKNSKVNPESSSICMQSSSSKSPTITTLNSNYLTSSFVPNEEYTNKLINHSPSISPMTYYTDPPPSSTPGSLANGISSTKPRKRRRSSHLNTKEDFERKRRELKVQHSIIEKRRRVKMNREFEALKFLVPACRANILGGFNENNFENSSMMHKLTILQSTVEYIKYLHLVIRLLKLQMLIPKNTRHLFKQWLNQNGNLNFVDFDLDLQKYRDIDHDFNFDKLFMDVWKNDGQVLESVLDPISKEISSIVNGDNIENQEDEDDDDDDSAIPKKQRKIKEEPDRTQNFQSRINSFKLEKLRTLPTISQPPSLVSRSTSIGETIIGENTNHSRQGYSSAPVGSTDPLSNSLSDRSSSPNDSDSGTFRLPQPAIMDKPSLTPSSSAPSSLALNRSSPLNSVSMSSSGVNLTPTGVKSHSPLFWGLSNRLPALPKPMLSNSRNYTEYNAINDINRRRTIASTADVNTASQLLISIKSSQHKSSNIKNLLN